MIERDDGGPAFPHLGLYPGADGNLHPTPTQHCGLSLRDWFAGQALAGMLAHQASKDPCITGAPDLYGRDAYEIADAMLAARKKDQPHE